MYITFINSVELGYRWLSQSAGSIRGTCQAPRNLHMVHGGHGHDEKGGVQNRGRAGHSGKLANNYGKIHHQPPFLMGKLTVLWPFSIANC